MNEHNNVWIALIAAAGGIATALGLNHVIPALVKWWHEKIDHNRQKKAATVGEFKRLNERINILESELDKRREFETQTRATLNAMLPLMKEMMREHPDYVRLLDQLERNIIGNTTSSDGENTDL